MAYFQNLVQSVSQAISTTASVAASYSEDLKVNFSSNGSSNLSGLPYKVTSERIDFPTSSYQSKVWSLFDGVSKEDNSPVSIWIHNDSNFPNPHIQSQTTPNTHSGGYSSLKGEETYGELASNFLKKVRSTRHPNLLVFKDGLGVEGGAIYVVTERVRPLLKSLDPVRFCFEGEEDTNTKQVLMGFAAYKVAVGLKFLSETCSLSHGAINWTNILVTPSYDFKLGGLELLSKLEKTESSSTDFFCTSLSQLSYLHTYLPPQLNSIVHLDVDGLDQVKRYLIQDVGGLDRYMLGSLLYELSTQSPFQSHQFSNSLPKDGELAGWIKKLLHPNVKLRPKNLDGLLKSRYFEQPLIEVDNFLAELNFKEPQQLHTFFTSLPALTLNFPAAYLQHKLIPQLILAIEFGNGGQQALTVLLDLATKLEDEVYQEIILPPVVRLFQSNDRKLRADLLQQFSRYQAHFTPSHLGKSIFQELCKGFVDPIIPIRELTLKSTILLADRLTPSQINDTLLPLLYKLQFDPHPTIRANTLVGLGKLFPYVAESDKKVSFPKQLIRSLDDPFPPCKVNCVKVLTLACDSFQVEYLVAQLLPSVIKKLLDPDKNLREAASKLVEVLLLRVKEVAKGLPDTPPPPPPAQVPVSGGGGASGLASVAEGWTGWAVSSLQKSVQLGQPSAAAEKAKPSSTASTSTPSPPTRSDGNSPLTGKVKLRIPTLEAEAQGKGGDEASGWDDWTQDGGPEAEATPSAWKPSSKLATKVPVGGTAPTHKPGGMKLPTKTQSNLLHRIQPENYGKEVEKVGEEEDGGEEGWNAWGMDPAEEDLAFQPTKGRLQSRGTLKASPTGTPPKVGVKSSPPPTTIKVGVKSPPITTPKTKTGAGTSGIKSPPGSSMGKLSLSEKRKLHKLQQEKLKVEEKNPEEDEGWGAEW